MIGIQRIMNDCDKTHQLLLIVILPLNVEHYLNYNLVKRIRKKILGCNE
jgi:hypothetical protein